MKVKANRWDHRRLAALREKSGHSPTKVASAADVHPTTLASWEAGRTHPDAVQIEKLAAFYGVTVAYLYGEGRAA